MPVTLRQLQAYHAVSETAGFTAAAETLGLTQSAVSMLIRQLETELGLPVFQRNGRGAALTDFGRQIRPTVLRMLEDMDNLSAGAADLKALRRGALKLAVSQILACSWLPPVLTRFTETFPEVQVTLTDTTGDNVVEAVASGEAEIGLGPERSPPPGLVAPTKSALSAFRWWFQPDRPSPVKVIPGRHCRTRPGSVIRKNSACTLNGRCFLGCPSPGPTRCACAA